MRPFHLLNAFFTGSRIYGKPRPDSDIDMVVRMPYCDLVMLRQAFPNENRAKEGYEDSDTVVFEFGKLNLICVSDDEAFAKWVHGTIKLISEAPVDKEHAVLTLEEIRHGKEKAYSKVQAKAPVLIHEHICKCGAVFKCTANHPNPHLMPECPTCEIPF